MAKLIEFCGAPGVGKTTLYLSLCQRWKASERWIPAHTIYPRKASSSSPLKRMMQTFLEKERPLDDKAMRKAGGRFVAKFPEYVDQCWVHIMEKEKKGLNGTDQRFEKASHVFKMMQRVQSCQEYQAAKTVVIEEGVINGIGNALHVTNPGAVDEEIKRLYQHLPLPAGLIFVEADADLVVKRIKARKRFIPSFENLPQNDLLRAIEEVTVLRKAAAEIYRTNGHPVLKINAANPVKQNADTIFEFVKTIV